MWKNEIMMAKDPWTHGKMCSFYLVHAMPIGYYKKGQPNKLTPQITLISVLASNSHITFTKADVLCESNYLQQFTTIYKIYNNNMSCIS